MIDYLPSTDPAWNMLFFGQPYRTIGQFSQYRATLEQLPAAEQAKVDDAADYVINSFLNPVMTGGMVMAIGCRGHADQDLQKTGKARLDFEQQISEERANKVAAALMKAIKAKAFRLNAFKILGGEPFNPVIQGVGAKMLLKKHPGNEFERSLNRRVDIFFLRDWEPLGRLSDFDVPPQKSFENKA